MNVELLLKVKAKILAKPRQFYMQSWFTDSIPRADIPRATDLPCATAACIGGWVLSIESKLTPSETWNRMPSVVFSEVAAKILKLNRYQADRLFLKRRWPGRFWGGKTPIELAVMAADRIDHFIATEGRE